MSSANGRRTAAAQRRRRRLLGDMCWRPRRCEIMWDDSCEGVAVDPHEPLLRSRGGPIDDPANIVFACRHCHDEAHRFPAEAERRGWIIPSGVQRAPVSGPCRAPTAAELALPDPF